MRFLKHATIIRLKLMITPSYVISIIFVPFLLSFILLSYNSNFTNTINVGVMYSSEDFQSKIQKTLENYAQDSINFILFNNEDEMIKNVMNYKLDSAYYFGEKLLTTPNQSIKVYQTQTTTSTKTLNILIASVVMQSSSGELGYKVLKKYIDKSIQPDIIKKEILENSYKYTENGNMMNITYKFLDSPIDKPKPIFSIDNIFYGILAALALYTSILSVGVIIKERKSSILSRLKVYSKNEKTYYYSFFIALFFINLFFLSFSQLILSFFYKPSFSFFNIVFSNMFYSLCISMFSLFLTVFLKNNMAEGLAIFLFLLSLIFGGVIVNVKDIISAFEPLKYIFFISYYLDGLNDKDVYMYISIFSFISFFFFVLFQFKLLLNNKN